MAASLHTYLNGIGGASGDEIVTAAPLYLFSAARVWYVLSTTGVDAASPAGRQREKPLATFAQAYTNAAAGDIITMLPGHAETVAASLVINKAALVIVSEGTGTSRARFTAGVAGIMWDLAAHSIQVRNCYFPASTVAPVGTSFQISSLGARLQDCYFECGALDTVSRVKAVAGAGHTRVKGTTFIVTASQPSTAFEASAAQNGLTFDECTFDGGTFGFSAAAILGSAAVTGVRGEQTNMFRNADALFATGTTGYWYPGASSGSALLEQTA